MVWCRPCPTIMFLLVILMETQNHIASPCGCQFVCKFCVQPTGRILCDIFMKFSTPRHLARRMNGIENVSDRIKFPITSLTMP